MRNKYKKIEIIGGGGIYNTEIAGYYIKNANYISLSTYFFNYMMEIFGFDF